VPKPAPDLPAMLERARRLQLIQLLVALVLIAAISGGVGYYIYWIWQDAEGRILASQDWSAKTGRTTVSNSSNHLYQVRQLHTQAALAAEQARRDRDAVTALRIESASTITNAALDLIRRLARQINEHAQTNLMAFDLNYAARLKDLDDQVEKQRLELQKQVIEKLKQLNKELGKYDPLLKIDPDVAERIATALKQLKQLVEITELLKIREEEDVKNLQNQLAILTEKIKVLDLRLSQLQTSVTAITNILFLPRPPGATNAPPPTLPKPGN
jgi:hypothetical protein